MAVVPDPVTCFSTARYSQKQVFRVVSDSNVVIVDWITSGRHESGEKWDFDLYKSTNRILLEGDLPLFIDTVMLFSVLFLIIALMCCCLLNNVSEEFIFNKQGFWIVLNLFFVLSVTLF